jgi:hypothetical protein
MTDPWWYIFGKRDLRVESWPLMATPYPTLVITGLYIVVIYGLLFFMK